MYSVTIMVGNLTRDIELKYLPSGAAIAKSAIATSYKYKSASGEQKEEVCFIDFTMFGRSAEVANQYLKKGSKVLLEGRLVFEQWNAQDGSSRSKHSLRVENMKMLDSQNRNGQSNDNYNTGGDEEYHQHTNYNHQETTNPATTSGNSNIGQTRVIPEIDIDEDEIPF